MKTNQRDSVECWEIRGKRHSSSLSMLLSSIFRNKKKSLWFEDNLEKNIISFLLSTRIWSSPVRMASHIIVEGNNGNIINANFFPSSQQFFRIIDKAKQSWVQSCESNPFDPVKMYIVSYSPVSGPRTIWEPS